MKTIQTAMLAHRLTKHPRIVTATGSTVNDEDDMMSSCLSKENKKERKRVQCKQKARKEMDTGKTRR